MYIECKVVWKRRLQRIVEYTGVALEGFTVPYISIIIMLYIQAANNFIKEMHFIYFMKYFDLIRLSK